MILFIFIVGSCIGSFLNIYICRIIRGEFIDVHSSHCVIYDDIKYIELVTILNRFFLKKKCRKCYERISFKHTLVELVNGGLYLLLFIKFGLTINLILYALLTSLLIVISVIDLKSKYIYTNNIILGLILACIYIFLSRYTGNFNIIDNILGGVTGFTIIYLIVVNTGAMGEGDADLAGVCGLFLGVKGVILTLFLSIVIAGVVAFILLLAKLKNRKSEIAFGPYISIGTIICILYGQELLLWYINFPI